MDKLFVYGTLMHDGIFRQVTGAALPSLPAIAPGHMVRSLIGHIYPVMIKAHDGQSACGRIIRHVSPSQLKALDDYEDDFYDREIIRVLDGNQQVHHAWAYILPPQSALSVGVASAPWSWPDFVENHLDSFLKSISRR